MIRIRTVGRAGIAVLLAVFPAAVPARGQADIPEMPVTVYQTADAALRETFPAATRFDVETRVLTADQRTGLAESLGGPVADDTVLVHRAWKDDALVGYGVVSEEIGKYRPITFLVGTTPELVVARVTVLVYRESHGADVRRARFLNQYQGKDAGDPIRLNKDIINIAGATLSVRSLNFGVKKVLGILGAFYGGAR
jgi:Na+-translocating ferredoxin:NAD+ oxidoreductase RnfG subunit